MGFFHFPVFDDKRVTLAARSAEDRLRLEAQVEGVRELEVGVAQKSDLSASRQGAVRFRPCCGPRRHVDAEPYATVP